MDEKKSVKNPVNALVVEGGAMRGVFSTGVLDAFLAKGFNPFGLAIGVSAGATNLAAFLADMPGRNRRVYTDYSIRPDFINWRKFLTGGHLIDLDWLWGVTINEIRLDLKQIFASGTDFCIGATRVDTGDSIYLRPTGESLEEMIKASSAIPILYRKFVRLNEMDLTDGGLADPIPVLEAYRRGARNMVVLRSRPYSYTMKAAQTGLNKLFLRKYPRLVSAIMKRPAVYQRAIDFIRNPPEGVRMLEVNPPEKFRTGRLTKDKAVLEEGYRQGLEAGFKVVEEWERRIIQ